MGGWLQDKMSHFLCHNIAFCKVLCIYMLLTSHKKMSILWLDLKFQL